MRALFSATNSASALPLYILNLTFRLLFFTYREDVIRVLQVTFEGDKTTTTALQISKDYGYVLLAGIWLYLNSALILVIPVNRARKKYGVKAPTIYPRDSEIKKLKMSDADVKDYMSCQRGHLNNVEFSSVFVPILLVGGLVSGDRTFEIACAGMFAAFFRMLEAALSLWDAWSWGAIPHR